MADPDGALSIWDNSNISESYGGVTTPLTFSFARRAYEEVYRQFCYMMRVSEDNIDANADTFRRMIGLIDGRIYYNLLNWYRVLALLPGFRINRRFMEQMMGVSATLPEEMISELDRSSWATKFKDGLSLLRTAGALFTNHFFLPKKIKAFYTRLAAALVCTEPRVEDMRADELVRYYRDLEQRLLTKWDAPLINDFFAMIFYGTLRKLTEKWFKGEEGLHNSLLVGEGGIISAEPARRVREMAETAVCDPQLVEALCNESVAHIMRMVDSNAQFKLQYDDYLARFGDRCLDELKLESETLHDDPLPLLRSVGHTARRLALQELNHQPHIESETRTSADSRVEKALSSHPLRRVIFQWVTRQARRRIVERENLRFERTRLFGRVRRIFVELGRRFHSLDLINSPRDIFYLEVEEALGFVEGTATTTNLKSLVALRKSEFELHCCSVPPASRFETRGITNHGNSFQGASDQREIPRGDSLIGTGCSPGIARGRARIISDPKNAVIQPGEILIAERTDPGWIMLFASAAAIAVERGSLLSHSAIVAREMGIPAIVSVKGITEWVSDGDWIEIDGSAGTVVRLIDQSADQEVSVMYE
jgi:pyruvate,water dikinase